MKAGFHSPLRGETFPASDPRGSTRRWSSSGSCSQTRRSSRPSFGRTCSSAAGVAGHGGRGTSTRRPPRSLRRGATEGLASPRSRGHRDKGFPASVTRRAARKKGSRYVLFLRRSPPSAKHCFRPRSTPSTAVL